MARRKVSRSQLGLPGVDARQREPVTVQHVTDFSAMALGTGAGDGFVVVRCPKCLLPCVVTRPGPQRWAFVHTACFVAGPKSTRMERIGACELEDEVIAAMRKVGAVTLSASGGLIGTADNAPEMASVLAAAIAERRREME